MLTVSVLKEVYIDDVTFGQLDASEDYVKITEKLQNLLEIQKFKLLKQKAIK